MGNKGFNIQKIFKIVRWGALAAPAVAIVVSPMSGPRKIRAGVLQYFGVDTDTGKFNLNNLRKGWEPYFWANVTTRVIPKAISFLMGVFS